MIKLWILSILLAYTDSTDQNRISEKQRSDVPKVLTYSPDASSLDYANVASKELLSLKSKGSSTAIIKLNSEGGYFPPALWKEKEKITNSNLQEQLGFEKGIKTDNKYAEKRLAFRLKMSPKVPFKIKNVEWKMKGEKYWFKIHTERDIEKSTKTSDFNRQVHLRIDKMWRIDNKGYGSSEIIGNASEEHFLFNFNKGAFVDDSRNKVKRGKESEVSSGNNQDDRVNALIENMWEAPPENFIFTFHDDNPVDDSENIIKQGEEHTVPSGINLKNVRANAIIGTSVDDLRNITKRVEDCEVSSGNNLKDDRFIIIIGSSEFASPSMNEINYKRSWLSSGILKRFIVFSSVSLHFMHILFHFIPFLYGLYFLTKLLKTMYN